MLPGKQSQRQEEQGSEFAHGKINFPVFSPTLEICISP